MRIADADVLFEEDGAAGETPTGTPTATPTPTPNGTATANGTETPTDTPEGSPFQAGFPDFFYDPVGLLVRPGQVVEFRTMPAEVQVPRAVEHTVTAFAQRTGFPQRVPEEAPGFSSPPIYVEESWLYRFDAEGVYDVLCLPHFGLGMVMRLVVIEEGSEEMPEAPPVEEGQLPGPVTQVLTAEELDPANVVEQGQVAWTDLTVEGVEPPIGGPGEGGEDGGQEEGAGNGATETPEEGE